MNPEPTSSEQAANLRTVIGNSDSAVEATLLGSSSSLSSNGMKQERDLAFAVTAIELGYLTQKQLNAAVKDWTIHGDRTLPAHLQDKEILDADACREVEDLAESKLQRVTDYVESSDPSGSQSLSTSLIRYLDQNGRIAGCLGLNYSSVAELEHQSRTTPTDYRLLKKLGQGGLGVVWLARDERLKRMVAIKEILRKANDDSPEVRRFRREAEITGRLEHPSIVPLHQFGYDEQTEQPFYVMRYIGKRTLENAIDEYHERRLADDHDPLMLHYLLSSFVSVCQAIAYAHSKNVVHRDLKPENVALDNYGQVIVLDWGLAKLTGELELIEAGEQSLDDHGTGVTQTQDGQVLGTPMYMAPEQASGRIEEIDERTDVYGLGAVLFAILTGYGPHEKSRESLSGSSQMSELLHAIVSRPAPAASQLNAEVPPELEAICAKALSIKQYSRYTSAAALAEDVQRWTAGEPVSAYRAPWKKRAARWIGQHRLLSQITAGVLMVLIVSGISFGVAQRNAAQSEQQSRFEGLKSEAHGLQMKMESRAEELTKNVRFMSTVPPIKGIVDARKGVVAEDGDSEEIWQTRLQNIYSGLLAANPNYLAVTFLAYNTGETDTKQKMGISEVVRVERNLASGGMITAVPITRLKTLEETTSLAAIGQRKPGEVHLEETSLVESSSGALSEGVISGGIPVFDPTTGEFFGAVIIETDLESGLRSLTEGLIHTASEAFVVNNAHRVLLHFDQSEGFEPSDRGKGCECLPLPVQEWLLSDKVLQSDQFTDGKSVLGQKIHIGDGHSADWLALVLVLE